MDGLRQLTIGETPRTLEDHVLQVMRNARTFPTAFLRAAGPHPRLNRAEADVRAVHVDDLQTVGEHTSFGVRASDLAEAEAFKK